MELLFPKEEEVMYTIWEVGHPCVISEILKQNPDLKRNTVAKVILILEEKGYVTGDSIVKTVTRTGRAYRALISKETYDAQKKLMADIVDSPSAERGMLKYCASLVNTTDVSEEFLTELEAIIDQLRNTEGK